MCARQATAQEWQGQVQRSSGAPRGRPAWLQCWGLRQLQRKMEPIQGQAQGQGVPIWADPDHWNLPEPGEGQHL